MKYRRLLIKGKRFFKPTERQMVIALIKESGGDHLRTIYDHKNRIEVFVDSDKDAAGCHNEIFIFRSEISRNTIVKTILNNRAAFSAGLCGACGNLIDEVI